VNSLVILCLLGLLAAGGYFMGRGRALSQAAGHPRNLHSLPSYYGAYVALWCGLPALAVMALWLSTQGTVIDHLVVAGLPDTIRMLPADKLSLFMTDVKNLLAGVSGAGAPRSETVAAAEHYRSLRGIAFAAMSVVVLAIAIGGLILARTHIVPHLRARNRVERIVMGLLIAASLVAILTTVGIVLSLLFEAGRFFDRVAPTDFFFGLLWSPQTAIRADQVAAEGAFGVLPLLAGTMLISFIAMCVAVPVGLLSAIYLAEYATPKVRALAKPALEILAGIPTVVYGFFAALTVAPLIRGWGEGLGLDVASESALAAGVVMGIMIIPFVSSLSDDVITAVPQSLREGSYGLGATQSETIRQVILPAALPGIVGSILLAASRAIGETMIVVMAAGLAANLTANPLEAVTTVTVQIVTLLIGDQEFDSAKTLAAFALGLTLFVLTLALNIVALQVVKKYREKYD
jgi:phosphate transport system permease protein